MSEDKANYGNLKELYGKIYTSSIRTKIMQTLNKNSPLTQSQIAKLMKRKQQDIYREIQNLLVDEVIECITPDKQSYKAYAITDKGKAVSKFKF